MGGRGILIAALIGAIVFAAAGGLYLAGARQLRAATDEARLSGCQPDAGPPPEAYYALLDRLDALDRVPWLRDEAFDVRDYLYGSCRYAFIAVCTEARDAAEGRARSAVRAERDRRLEGPGADREAIIARHDAASDALDWRAHLGEEVPGLCQAWARARALFAAIGAPVTCAVCDG
jgi:hypothetical protein